MRERAENEDTFRMQLSQHHGPVPKSTIDKLFGNNITQKKKVGHSEYIFLNKNIIEKLRKGFINNTLIVNDIPIKSKGETIDFRSQLAIKEDGIDFKL